MNRFERVTAVGVFSLIALVGGAVVAKAANAERRAAILGINAANTEAVAFDMILATGGPATVELRPMDPPCADNEYPTHWSDFNEDGIMQLQEVMCERRSTAPPPATAPETTTNTTDSRPSNSSNSSNSSGSNSQTGNSGHSSQSDSSATGSNNGLAALPFRERMTAECDGQVGDSRLAEGLEWARGGEDHNRIIVLAELCSLMFGETVDDELGRPLSSLEQVIADGAYSVTVNEDQARLVRAYSDAAYAAGDDWALIGPGAEESADPAEPVECYFNPVNGGWYSFDIEKSEINLFLEVGCDGDPVGTRAFVIAESIEEANSAECMSPTPLSSRMIPATPESWYGCEAAA